jgi:hypothetical protein
LHINVGFKNSVEWEAVMKARLPQCFSPSATLNIITHFYHDKGSEWKDKGGDCSAWHCSSVDKNFALHWPQEQSQGCENAGK